MNTMNTVASRRGTNCDPQVNRTVPTAAVPEMLAEATPRRSESALVNIIESIQYAML